MTQDGNHSDSLAHALSLCREEQKADVSRSVAEEEEGAALLDDVMGSVPFAQQAAKGRKAEQDDGYTLQHVRDLRKHVPTLAILDLGRIDMREDFLSPLAGEISSFSHLTKLKLSPPHSMMFWSTLQRRCATLRKLTLLPAPPGLRDRVLSASEFCLPTTILSLVVKHALDPSVFRDQQAAPQVVVVDSRVRGPPLRLERLVLAHSSTRDDLVTAALQGCPHLQHLQVQSHNCDGVSSLRFLTCTPSLTSLHIEGLQWSFQHVVDHLCQPDSPKLAALSLLCALTAFQMMVNPESLQAPVVWSKLVDKQNTLQFVKTNLVRTDAELVTLERLGRHLQYLVIRDGTLGSDDTQCAPLRFSPAAWRAFFAACSQVRVWGILSHRNTGLASLHACLAVPNSARPLPPLQTISVKFDDDKEEEQRQERSACLLPPLPELCDLQAHGGCALSFGDVVRLLGPASCDAGLPAVLSPCTLLDVVVPGDFLDQWAGHALALPLCTTVHLCFSSSTATHVNMDAWLRVMQKYNCLPALTSLTITLPGAGRLVFSDAGARVLAESWPGLRECTVIASTARQRNVTASSVVEEDSTSSEHGSANSVVVPHLTVKGLQCLVALERLSCLRILPCRGLLPKDMDVLKSVRDDVWSKCSVAPPALAVYFGPGPFTATL